MVRLLVVPALAVVPSEAVLQQWKDEATGEHGCFSLEQVTETNRWRIMLLSREEGVAIGRQYADELLEEFSKQRCVVKRDHPLSKEIAKIVASLLQHVHDTPGAEWKLYVIASDVENACALPGGKIFVFSGMVL